MAEKKTKPAEIKTKPTTASVEDFINSISEEQKRKDSFVLLEIIKEAIAEEPVLWGSSIIGFGDKKYKSSATGREVDWFRIGFSPRKANLTLYLITGIKQHAVALEKLGKYKVNGGCLYIKKMEDIDLNILKGIISTSLKE